MNIRYESITAQNPGADAFTESATVTPTNPAGEAVISCALNHVEQLGANGNAQIAITGYVQNGQTQTGNWPVISGQNITSVTAGLTVSTARASGTVIFISD